ncbi:hypothetical protein SDC9_111573 [bioreactor metagenome]|uniref:Uncharacterized protein n=1 Tax=bioreactor metagenome TaxID=1076179 RepID=A0A645BH39_9ZZZZ
MAISNFEFNALFLFFDDNIIGATFDICSSTYKLEQIITKIIIIIIIDRPKSTL